MAVIEISHNENIKQAWHSFVQYGILDENIIRQDIAQSWLRSRQLDPSKFESHILSNTEFSEKKSVLKELITIAKPIMQEIWSFSPQSYVMLCDREGRILEITSNGDINKLDLIPVVGMSCSEQHMGTNAIALSMIKNGVVETKGYEHYCSYNHNLSCAALSIHDSHGKVIGVLSITNPLGELFLGSIAAINLAVMSIEFQLKYHFQLKCHSEQYALRMLSRTVIIENRIDYVLAVNDKGVITNINKNCIVLLGLKNKEEIIGTSLNDLLITQDKITPGLIYSSASNVYSENFSIRNAENILSCNLIDKVVIEIPGKGHQTVLTFVLNNPEKKTSLSKTASVPSSFDFNHLIGSSREWTNIINSAKKAAMYSSNVLIEGESGTGKELLAQAIHNASGRHGLFIPINCGAIAKELLNSELFGYEDGSFTGAKKGGSKGKFESADKGTVFLDEIGEMPLDMQVSLLRFLQDRKVVRVGGIQERRVDIRIIAATNRNLSEEIANGKFREDLYYRLCVIDLKVPPLRKRKEDIPHISRYLVGQLCNQLGKKDLFINEEVLAILSNYKWPGNVRQLSNVLENAVVFAEGDTITSDSLPAYLVDYDVSLFNKMPNDLKDAEKMVIIETLKKYRGNISHVAKALGIARNTLYRKMKELDIY